tara:strand:- start:5384 stop:6418 length:1035 start_codon:yes stop_codon:yes gene_type:complete
MIKRLIESVLHRSNYLTNKLYSGEGHIFMLHRILPIEEKSKYEYNFSLAITPSGLEKFINKFQSDGYDFISLDEALVRLEKPKEKKFICFTIDDGYSDNLTYALPIFKKYNIPFTIYISNCFPDNKAICWWYDLEKYIKKFDYIDLTSIGVDYKYDNSSIALKDSNYSVIREIFRRSSLDIHQRFIIEKIGISLDEYYEKNKSRNLTWEEIKFLDKDPLVTIGGHTLNHLSLKNQSDEEVENQVVNGLRFFKEKSGIIIQHFAYPYGSLDDFDQRSIKILKSNGIKTAVLNHPGGIFKDNLEFSYQIPRIGLSDETSAERLEEFFNGKLHLNFNGINKLVVPLS